MTTEHFKIDPVHQDLDIYNPKRGQKIVWDIWHDKYAAENEQHPNDTFARVANALFPFDPEDHLPNESRVQNERAYEALSKNLWVPGGRILSSIGTGNRTTAMNCYVMETMEDSMDGILSTFRQSALTMQQGGGIGIDITPLRPAGAHLERTNAIASGPLPFADMWDAMCKTIMSAGSRRGAMMVTCGCEHPDLVDFITAKEEKGRLTNFNMSVLITDAFMAAVEDDETWFLGHECPKHDGSHLYSIERDDEYFQGRWYVYSSWKARELWDLIIKHTYDYAEPGIIFIDRLNDGNNLQYCERINCTNPCGEQSLPPNGCCNLGAVNLARMVKRPFKSDAEFDWNLLEEVVGIGVDFLDRVIDETGYPLEEQEKEEKDKRRIGLGIMGLANCLDMLGFRYGSEEAIDMTRHIMKQIAWGAYHASAKLAGERGPFPLYDKDSWGQTALVSGLGEDTQDLIRENGIRNGVLLTIAPTGTTAILSGYVSGGLEPVFAYKQKRYVRGGQEEPKQEYFNYDYGYLVWCAVTGRDPAEQHTRPAYMVEHDQITVAEHVAIQSVCQKNIDASISKTINCPEDIDFEAFKDVYKLAYDSGCKGCTTYRPSDVRGAVLEKVDQLTPEELEIARQIEEADRKREIEESILNRKRPATLMGKTYKESWQGTRYYITVNDMEGSPREIFVHSTSSQHTDWTTALSLVISALMRFGIDISFVAEELKKVVSAAGGTWIDGKYYGSLAALIGHILERHTLDPLDSTDERKFAANLMYETMMADEARARAEVNPSSEKPPAELEHQNYSICPACNAPALVHKEGCEECLSCNYSRCG